jgi:plastocyanin
LIKPGTLEGEIEMKRKITVAISVMAASLIFVTGCGKKPGAGPASEPAPAEKEAAAPAPAPEAGVGTIKGVVKFTGTPPTMPELNRQSDPFCAKTKMKAQFVVVNENGTLKNVAVRTEGAQGGTQKTAEVEVDQLNCMYSPRVQTGWFEENIKIVNSDPTLHNVHTYSGTKTLFNQAQPKGSPPITKKFSKKDGNIVKFKCDVHPWMTGWMVVDDNGFNAVTGDTGEFEIKDVPVGTYTLKSFQEKFGEKSQEVTVEKDKVTEVEFSYDGSEKAAYKYQVIEIGMSDHDHNHQH